MRFPRDSKRLVSLVHNLVRWDLVGLPRLTLSIDYRWDELMVLSYDPL